MSVDGAADAGEIQNVSGRVDEANLPEIRRSRLRSLFGVVRENFFIFDFFFDPRHDVKICFAGADNADALRLLLHRIRGPVFRRNVVEDILVRNTFFIEFEFGECHFHLFVLITFLHLVSAATTEQRTEKETLRLNWWRENDF